MGDKPITEQTIRDVLSGLLVVEDELVAALSGAMNNFQRRELLDEICAELRGLANRIDDGGES